MLVAFVFDAQLFSNSGNSLFSFEKMTTIYRRLTTDYILSGTLIPSSPIAEAITLAVISDN